MKPLLTGLLIGATIAYLIKKRKSKIRKCADKENDYERAKFI